MGDFNAHSYLWGPVNLPDRADVIEYLLEDYNMSVLNNGTPTRNPAPPTERRAPDLSICSASLRQNYTWAVGDDPLGSDHIPITIRFQTSVTFNLSLPSQPNLTRSIDWAIYSTEVLSRLAGREQEELAVNRYDKLYSILVDSA